MSRRTMTIMAAVAVLAWPLAQSQAAGLDLHASASVVGDVTSVPYGWVDFCNRYAGECDGPVLPAQALPLNAKTFKELDHINRSVNKKIEPVTDMDHWGVVDQWDYPLDGKGDCEDYALYKRKLLIEAGVPRQALLMTVVKDHEGEGHALLTVVTTKGDLVLDNMVDSILSWDQTGYRFVKRQSQEDPNVWRTIAPTTSAPLYTANQ